MNVFSLFSFVIIHKIIWNISFHKQVKERNNDEYVKKQLKAALAKELQYVEEKKKAEMETKALYGDDMYKRLHDIGDSRKDAFGSGNFVGYSQY